MTTAKEWSGEALEALLAAQGIALAPGRAERHARAQQSLLEASAGDPLRAVLDFRADPTTFLLALRKCR